MTIREMREQLKETQSGFSARYGIPVRTVQNWEAGIRKPPEYIELLLEERVKSDLVNHKTATLPEYNAKKLNLPRRCDYIGAMAWLEAVYEALGRDVVFGLDEALMCEERFGGRNDEFVIWVYGDDSMTRYNGVVVLGNRISTYEVESKNGIRYTKFNRTLCDALTNEDLLDMQGITEALSRYYFEHENSFAGIVVPPEYQERFESLARDAAEYYSD
ncbi:MAG: helix-turn-helix domain-containing protein [Lachnospiraceae bacterium]|nr:helix-turn-helix domain-containing protein [Lachnospiraceae bacterium]